MADAEIGLIGLGVMGFPMAGHLVERGGHDVTRQPEDDAGGPTSVEQGDQIYCALSWAEKLEAPQDGTVSVNSGSISGLPSPKAIEAIIEEPEIGRVYEGPVKSVTAFNSG